MSEYRMTAVFPTVARAKTFAAHIADWPSTTELARAGRTVTWVGRPSGHDPDDGLYPLDLLETVGSIGSSAGRYATLNGARAPIEY